jgi:hypothetical protein
MNRLRKSLIINKRIFSRARQQEHRPQRRLDTDELFDCGNLHYSEIGAAEGGVPVLVLDGMDEGDDEIEDDSGDNTWNG